MCNAHNHPAGCTCGWGGDGHRGRNLAGTDGNTSYFHSNGHNEQVRNGITHPNSRCPVCGESVFFYQSPDGGRVFFDQLGPPWPKHPCTAMNHHETGTSFKRLKPAVGRREPSTQHIDPNWFQLRSASTIKFHKKIYRIDGRTNDGNFRMYVNGQDFDLDETMQSGLENSNFAYVRRLNETKFELSFLGINGSPRSIYGSASPWATIPDRRSTTTHSPRNVENKIFEWRRHPNTLTLANIESGEEFKYGQYFEHIDQKRHGFVIRNPWKFIDIKNVDLDPFKPYSKGADTPISIKNSTQREAKGVANQHGKSQAMKKWIYFSATEILENTSTGEIYRPGDWWLDLKGAVKGFVIKKGGHFIDESDVIIVSLEN